MGLHSCPSGTLTTLVFLAGLTRIRDILRTSKRLRQFLFTKAGFFSEQNNITVLSFLYLTDMGVFINNYPEKMKHLLGHQNF